MREDDDDANIIDIGDWVPGNGMLRHLGPAPRLQQPQNQQLQLHGPNLAAPNQRNAENQPFP